jgi:hypothetical protein
MRDFCSTVGFHPAVAAKYKETNPFQVCTSRWARMAPDRTRGKFFECPDDRGPHPTPASNYPIVPPSEYVPPVLNIAPPPSIEFHVRSYVPPDCAETFTTFWLDPSPATSNNASATQQSNGLPGASLSGNVYLLAFGQNAAVDQAHVIFVLIQ